MIKKINLGVLALLTLAVIVTFVFYASSRSEKLAALEAGSQIAETSAGPIEYQFIGDSGPVLLFLHGTPGGYDQATAIPGTRVLAPSRPGYLRTALEVGQTPTAQAHAYAALLDSLSINSVVVMGASGGGPSSIAFASLYPDRTLGLIAMEAVSQPTVITEVQEEPPFLMQLLTQSDFFMWASISLMETFMGPEALVSLMIPDPENQQLVLEDASKTAQMESLILSTWPISQRQAGQDNDLVQFETPGLSSETITVPTLIIHGTEDANVPYEQSELLAEQISGSVLHTIEGADHMMPFSHAEEVAAATADFLNEHNFK
jgi:pimeloyl-ACP methyl ester carboxylesterase